MHRFFVDPETIQNSVFKSQDKDLCHQISKVLKMRAGKKVILCDNSQHEYKAEWTTVSKSVCEATIHEKTLVPDISDEREVHLYVPPLKNQNRWELILEKGTELGVASFTPLITKRTEVEGLRKPERLHRIIKEAAEQSNRSLLPTLREPRPLEDCWDHCPGTALILSLHEKSQLLSDITLDDEVHVFIGPVGDFTEEEVESSIEHKFYSISLGQQVLRTETAAIATAAKLLLS